MRPYWAVRNAVDGTLSIMLGTAMEVARSSGSPLPLGEACVEAWTEAQTVLGPGVDHTAAVRYWEQVAGTELGKT